MTAVTVGNETRQGSRAVARHIRSSAFKAREVLDLVRGKSYAEAREILTLSERRISDTIAKCLDSAVANAEHNDDLDGEELFIAACYADEGPTLKRHRPRARGRATTIRKRTCHITVVLARYTDDELAAIDVRMAAKGTRRRSSAVEARRRRVAASKQRDSNQTEDHDHDHEPNNQTDTETDTDTDTDNLPDTETDTDNLPDTETDTDNLPDTEPDTTTDTDNLPDTEPDTTTDVNADNDEKEA
ncbi:50S ribosomal protein L22 [Candidatus Poriferisocius sp.]|uniref:50S ribosomal protein L22 n=1 Tax=Candidatus Poriferisocius sp. TaxID=3101276 RepID=UPI003B0183A7